MSEMGNKEIRKRIKNGGNDELFKSVGNNYCFLLKYLLIICYSILTWSESF